VSMMAPFRDVTEVADLSLHMAVGSDRNPL
jgi:hypothetical protein